MNAETVWLRHANAHKEVYLWNRERHVDAFELLFTSPAAHGVCVNLYPDTLDDRFLRCVSS